MTRQVGTGQKPACHGQDFPWRMDRTGLSYIESSVKLCGSDDKPQTDRTKASLPWTGLALVYGQDRAVLNREQHEARWE